MPGEKAAKAFGRLRSLSQLAGQFTATIGAANGALAWRRVSAKPTTASTL